MLAMALRQVCSQINDRNRLLGSVSGHELAMLHSSNGCVLAPAGVISLAAAVDQAGAALPDFAARAAVGVINLALIWYTISIWGKV